MRARDPGLRTDRGLHERPIISRLNSIDDPIEPEVSVTGRLFTVEENPRLGGWGAEVVSIVGEEAFYDLYGPIVRITTPHSPLPAADVLEDMAIPSVDRIVATITKAMQS